MSTQIERPLGDILRDIANNIGEIIRSEFQLAKTELSDRLVRLARPATTTAIGAMLGMYALGFLLLTIMFVLRIAIPEWLAALIVFCIAGVLGSIMLAAGLHGLWQVRVAPDRTVATVKENVQWAKQQLR
jgi:uncharacterized membrane protein YqjE